MSLNETCDFCNKKSVLGCNGVGPQTEIGCIDIMSICPTCALTSLHSAIPHAISVIEEFNLNEMQMEEDEYDIALKFFLETKDDLQRYYCDQLNLAEEINTYYVNRYPGIIHPLNKQVGESIRSGVYTHCSNGNLSVEMHLRTIQDRLAAEAYSIALGLPSNTVIESSQPEQVLFT